MVVTKNMKHSALIEMLPPEILEKILKLLNYKEIHHAKLICKRWKGIIENGNLVEKALGKIFKPSNYKSTNSLVGSIPISQKLVHQFCSNVCGHFS